MKTQQIAYELVKSWGIEDSNVERLLTESFISINIYEYSMEIEVNARINDVEGLIFTLTK